MPKPMHRSTSFKKFTRHVRSGETVIRFRRGKPGQPHCAICGQELNGIAINTKGGKSRRTNNRLFGGVLCANCTADVIKMGSRVENGAMKLNEVGIRQRAYVLQLVAH